MMWSSTISPNAQTAVATTTLIASYCCFVAFRSHDQRAISEDEVMCARGTIAHISPPSISSYSSLSLKSYSHHSMGDEHMHNLAKYGATVVRKTLSHSQLVEWIKLTKGEFDGSTNTQNIDRRNNIVWQSGRAHCHISKTSIHYNKMNQVGCGCGDDINTKAALSSSWWADRWTRRKCNIKRQDDDIMQESHQLPPSPYLQDIVQSYFQQHGIQRYMLTDIQFLNAYPQSGNQIWHRDNTWRGLTAIVALCNIRDNGPTELILGSHQANFSVWSKWWNSVQNCIRAIKRDENYDEDSVLGNQVPPLLLGCIDAGDTLLYDARIFHRGRGYGNANYSDNHNDDEKNNGENAVLDRPVLVLRWDAANTPPPGAGIIVTSLNAYVGSMMYASLSVLREITAYNNE